MEFRGCQEGKATPKLTEIRCPKCGGIMEVFVYMGGSNTQTGRTTADETCETCGYTAPAGTPVSNFEKA